jgi:putative transposase
VSDTTELLVGESGAKMYLAVVLDLFSRFVVGWSVSAVNDRPLTKKALEMALCRRCPASGLLHHSDHLRKRGLPERAHRLRHHLLDEPARQLPRQCCHGELVLDVEVGAGGAFRELRIAKEQLFDYIEVFYNSEDTRL